MPAHGRAPPTLAIGPTTRGSPDASCSASRVVRSPWRPRPRSRARGSFGSCSTGISVRSSSSRTRCRRTPNAGMHHAVRRPPGPDRAQHTRCRATDSSVPLTDERFVLRQQGVGRCRMRPGLPLSGHRVGVRDQHPDPPRRLRASGAAQALPGRLVERLGDRWFRVDRRVRAVGGEFRGAAGPGPPRLRLRFACSASGCHRGLCYLTVGFTAMGLLLGGLVPTARAALAVGLLIWFVMLTVGGCRAATRGPHPAPWSTSRTRLRSGTPSRYAPAVARARSRSVLVDLHRQRRHPRGFRTPTVPVGTGVRGIACRAECQRGGLRSSRTLA